MKVALDLIEPGTRLRGVSVEQVMAIAESMKEVGLLSPITVYVRDVIRAGIAVQGYGLIAGLHRLEAAKGLGWDDIDAQIVTLPELSRQLAECDENLCGTKLTQSERALFTRRRKEIYEAIHPETRQGAVGRGGKSDPNIGSFVDDTAARTGRSRSSISADATRGERISEDVLNSIVGTDLDKGIVLDALAATPRDQQAARVEAMRAEPTRPKPTPLPKHEFETEQDWRNAMMRLWNRAPQEWRERFIEYVQQPVFDQTRAGAA